MELVSTLTAPHAEQTSTPRPPARGRNLKACIGLTVFAVLALFLVLVSPSDQTTTFLFALGGESFNLPDISLTSRVGTIICAVPCVVAAVLAWLLTSSRTLSRVLAAVMGFSFLMAFLCWAVAGKQINYTGLIQGALLLGVPYIFGSMSGVLCERSGVVNINIEGQLLFGAFLSAVVASLTQNPYLGLVAAPLAGMLLGLLLALFALRYVVDQIIVGVVLNVLALGLTNFLYSRVLAPNQDTWNSPPTLPTYSIPVLGNIPLVGPVLFQQNLLVYVMYAIVTAIQIGLFRTRWGLRVRAVGEHPTAADAVGIKVNLLRFRTVLVGSALAGLGGATLTIGSVGLFSKNVSAGKGFIALAAMIFGRWSPMGALGAALLFGLADNMQSVLSVIGTPVPSEFLLMAPYLATLLAVAGLVGRVRAPAADGVPYRKS